MDGWIKLHRKLLSNPLWKDCNSNHKVIMIEVKEGQLITSLKSISENSGCSIQAVRGALEKFEKHGFSTSKSTNKNRLITIENWGKYQLIEDEPTSTSTSNQQAINKQPTTNKNDKNDKNDKKDIVVSKFQKIIDRWNGIDKNIPKVKALNENTARYKNLKARVNQYGENKVLEAIEKIQDSSFLKGYVNNFVVTFDWFIKPNNFIKVLEGNYADKDNHGHASEVEEKYKDLDDIWMY